jgi:putative NADPH-quinone reductase
MKKILVINGHPKAESYCDSLTEKYIEGVKKNRKGS